MGVLSDHENQLEVVHSQSYIVELVHIGKEDDVLDCILYDLGVVRYSFTISKKKKKHRAIDDEERTLDESTYLAIAKGLSAPIRNRPESCTHAW